MSSLYNALLVSNTITQDTVDTWSVIGKKKLNGKALWASEGTLHEKLQERRVLRALRNAKFSKAVSDSTDTTAPAAEKTNERVISPAEESKPALTVKVARGNPTDPTKTFAAAARAGLEAIATITPTLPIQGSVTLSTFNPISKARIVNPPAAKKVRTVQNRGQNYNRYSNHRAVHESRSMKETLHMPTEDGWTVVVKKSGRR